MADIIDVNIGDSTLEVFWQDEVELNLDLNLMYIKSGQKEIQDYVDNVSKPEISNYVETEAKPLVSQIVEEIAEPTVMEYIEGTVKPDLDEYADSLKPDLQEYVTQAQTYANNSQSSAEASAASAAASLTSANNAKTSETNAKQSETNALSYKNAAKSSQDAAKLSETNAKESEDNAKQSELNAKTSETNALNYKNSAQSSATTATDKANITITKAQEALNSANNAKVSETNSKTSETKAKTSETNAASSATSAENSKNLAKQYADSAKLSSFGNIGDIQYTARNQVPNGGAWCDGTEYTQAQFPDIYQMLVDNKIANTPYTTYNDRIANFGFCGFFGLDTTNKKFKVPTLKDMFIKAGTTAIAATKESLPNITGNITLDTWGLSPVIPTSNFTGAFFGGVIANTNTYIDINDRGSLSVNRARQVNFDASRSSSTYRNGAKVNPDHVVYRAYVVLYTSAAEASEAQAAEFIQSVSSLTQQLTNKINVNADNITATGYANIFKNILPDYGAGIFVNTSSNYTAPNYGWFRFNSTKDSEQNITIKDVTYNNVIYSGGAARSYSPTITDFIFVEKGHVYQFTKDWGNFGTLYFYPIRGV